MTFHQVYKYQNEDGASLLAFLLEESKTVRNNNTNDNYKQQRRNHHHDADNDNDNKPPSPLSSSKNIIPNIIEKDNDHHHHHHYQQQEQHDDEEEEEEDTSVDFHFIVSSQCSSYQLWETISTFHSAEAVHQCGKFTWIISGCLRDGQEIDGKGKGGAQSDILTPTIITSAIQKHFPTTTAARDYNDNDDNDNDCSRIKPNLHFTPDYSNMSVYGGQYADGKTKRYYINPKNGKRTKSSTGNYYVFNNKPNGLLHWANNYADTTTSTTTTTATSSKEAIVLIDPDFLFLTKFRLARRDMTIVGQQQKGQQNQNQKVLQNKDLVYPGRPAGASYGLGAQWLEFNLTKICGRDSPCINTTRQEVFKYYSAGPPYVIHISDVVKLARKWSDLVPPTYDEYPLLYAEMFAYSMAASHLHLRHNLINGLFTGCMVSWPNPKRWGIDSKEATTEQTAIAESADLYIKQLTQELQLSSSSAAAASGTALSSSSQYYNYGPATSCFQKSTPPPPPMLHYCRRYMIQTTDTMKQHHKDVTYRFFAKRRVPHDTVLDCGNTTSSSSSNYFFPFESTNEHEKIEGGDPNWNALAVCTIVRTINWGRYRGCQQQQQQQ